MNDRVLVEALRARDPGALAALYDSHAESIYRYCWSILMSPDSAQVALRDTLIAAEAHVGALADPGRLRPWLHALARGECVRRRLSAVADPDEVPVQDLPLDEPGDADLRVMAWNATQSLSAGEREILELVTRHELSTTDVAAVVGVAPRQAETAQTAAREHLRDAITAEILARKGPYDCAGRARILGGFTGELTPDMREQVIRHLTRCDTCAPHRTRQVSTAKVFELLPVVALPETLRVRVMSCFSDPELVPYRRYVARRSAALDAAGFPVTGERKTRRWPQALAGALATVATVIAIAVIFHQFGTESESGLTGIASGAFPATGEPPGIRLPWQPDPQDTPVRIEPILDSSATYPIGSDRSIAPITATTVEPDWTQGPDPVPTSGATRKPVPVPVPSATRAGPTLGPHEPALPPEERPAEPPRDHQGRPTKTPCPKPTQKPTPPPTQKPTPPPTSTPAPTQTPKPTPTETPKPSETPKPDPTTPAPEPTKEPTKEPTPEPTPEPTKGPAKEPVSAQESPPEPAREPASPEPAEQPSVEARSEESA